MTAKDLWFLSLEKGSLFGNRLYPNDEIKINNKELKDKIIEVLSNVDWRKEINYTSMPSIKKYHIIDVLKKYIPDIS